MAIEIRQLRLTYIWTETTLRLLEDPPPAVPFAFLSGFRPYKKKFNEIAARLKGRGSASADASASIALALPWPGPAGQLFWTFYLASQPGYVPPDRAWQRLVPFRASIPAPVAPSGFPGSVRAEAFFYPHGHVLALTVDHKAPVTLEAAVEAAVALRRPGTFTPAGDPESGKKLSLEQFADSALEFLRNVAFGPQATAGRRSPVPFSIVTVLNGEGVDLDVATPEGGPTHSALETLTTWPPGGAHVPPRPLVEGALKIRRSALSHVLYASRRGRAVWFPSLFREVIGKPTSLSCYHRNLFFTSLQTESLGALIAETAPRLENTPLPTRLRECSQYAAQMLGALHQGDRAATYRSDSARAQIEQNDLKAPLNKVRKFFGLPDV